MILRLGLYGSGTVTIGVLEYRFGPKPHPSISCVDDSRACAASVPYESGGWTLAIASFLADDVNSWSSSTESVARQKVLFSFTTSVAVMGRCHLFPQQAGATFHRERRLPI
jgi:hypothetical protein